MSLLETFFSLALITWSLQLLLASHHRSCKASSMLAVFSQLPPELVFLLNASSFWPYLTQNIELIVFVGEAFDLSFQASLSLTPGNRPH